MTLYDISVKTIDGRETTLAEYRGQVLLIVNVASQCGFTPQYAGLEELYRRYRDQGFSVLGFPCNQFMKQEPGDLDAIRSFCSLKYNVTFPMFAKIDVNGPNAHPLYQFLKSHRRGFLGTQAIKWNFAKFLVDRSGNVVKRYSTVRSPQSIAGDIEPLLAARPAPAGHG